MNSSALKPAVLLASILLLAGLFCVPALADKTDKIPDVPLGDDLGDKPDGDGKASERAGKPSGGKTPESAEKDGAATRDEGKRDDGTCDGTCPAEGGKDDRKARFGARWGRRIHRDDENAAGALVGLALLVMGGLSLFALQFLVLLTFPAAVERIRVQAETRRLFSFALGLVNVVFLLLLMSVLGHAGGPGGGLAAVFLFLFLGLALFGLLAKAQHIGAKACALAGTSPNPAVALLFGWWTVFFVSLIPVVGWFLAAYWLVGGVGSVILSLFGGSPREDAIVENGGPDAEDSFESPVVKV